MNLFFFFLLHSSLCSTKILQTNYGIPQDRINKMELSNMKTLYSLARSYSRCSPSPSKFASNTLLAVLAFSDCLSISVLQARMKSMRRWPSLKNRFRTYRKHKNITTVKKKKTSYCVQSQSKVEKQKHRMQWYKSKT